MLVLARKKGQSIIIGKNIKIMVVEVTGDTVRLGIEAPTELEIFRTEIYQQLREENAGSIINTEEVMKQLKEIREKK